jgi:hypothetical protein
MDELKRALDEALLRLREAEGQLADQGSRIKSLGRGREETLLELNETRAALERVTAERDRLQGNFEAVERMQTETIALPDTADDARHDHALPSIEELMASLSLTDDGRDNAVVNAQRVEAPAGLDDSQIMIAPVLIAPEEFAGDETGAGSDHIDSVARALAGDAEEGALLVFLSSDRPVRYRLTKRLMTIGRGDTMDIRVEGEFISREHARIRVDNGAVSIEDAGSKNGIKVNKKRVGRQALRHGDVISIGKLLFAFIDTR